MSFSDCLVLEVARKAGHLPLGTFDRDLAKLDGGLRLARGAHGQATLFHVGNTL